MLALLLPFTLAAFWTVVGQAVFVACRARVGVLRSWLLAPALGLAVTVVALMLTNQGGIPIGHSARWIAGVLLIFALAVAAVRRPVLPGRALLPFAAAAAFFLAWAGWPLVHFGYHWTGYVNDDYLNYCLAADRFRDFGFYRVPTLPELTGRDYAQYYWFMHVLELMRFGSEHVIAWASALFGLRTFYVFLPVILAIATTQLGAAAALVLHRGRWRRVAGLTAWFLAVSPLFIFGAIYQLIAQVGGLALMLAFVALLSQPVRGRNRWHLLGAAVPAALTGTALAVLYPEISPFGVIALLGFLLHEAWRRRRMPGGRIVLLEYTLGLSLLLLRFNIVAYIYTLCRQAGGSLGAQDHSVLLFPFFLLPSGLPSLFGLQTMTLLPGEPWESILIVIGALALLAAIFQAVRLALRGEPIGLVFLVIFLVALKLFAADNDFGLYKTAMYLQPALYAALAWMLVGGRRSWLKLGIAALYIAAVLPVGRRYVAGTVNPPGPVINELMEASHRVAHPPSLPADRGYWAVGLNNVGASKLVAGIYRGVPLRYLDRIYTPVAFTIEGDYPLLWAYPHQDLYAKGHEIYNAARRELYSPESVFGTEFFHVNVPGVSAGFVAPPTGTGFFNKLPEHGRNPDALVYPVPAARAQNLALFVNSTRGNLYYLADRHRIGLGQREYDIYQPRGGIYAIGRFLLVRVENPSEEFYVRLLATKSLKGHGNTRWEKGSRIVGATEAELPVVGDGAANVFAGPVRPLRVNGAAYVAVQFADPATPFPNPRSGLNRLYNADLPFDYRRTVAFGRDLSLLTPEQFREIEPPRALQRFPEDLLSQPGLQFCGLYEDGWVSDQAYAVLARARDAECLRLRGYVPTIPGHPEPLELVLAINGAELARLRHPPGAFDWLLPAPPAASGTRIEIRALNPVTLPAPDGRPASVKLDSVALAPRPDRYDFSASPSGAGAPLSQGVDGDGWAISRAELLLPSSRAAHEVRLTVEYPDWGTGPKDTRVAASVDGAAPIAVTLRPGRSVIALPVPAGSSLHRVHLTGSSTFRLPAPDSRERALRVIDAVLVD